MNKKQLGQFYTTNYQYILQNMFIPDYVTHIIEPFCGQGDLLNYINNKKYTIEHYDIDPKIESIQQDTILNPPNYKNKYIITNPPYLARNKNNYKHIYNKYKTNDLYKCFLIELLTNICLGGIIIIPINFWSSIRKADIELRKKFLQIYSISLINIFEERVFSDTSYSICSIQFEQKITNDINIVIYPSKKSILAQLNDQNNYLFGGQIYFLPKSNYTIDRCKKEQSPNTNIAVQCIDNNKNNKIKLFYTNEPNKYIDKTKNSSFRSYALLVINPILNEQKQIRLVSLFNDHLNKHRDNYNSLFLTNYRESNNMARKRISFDLVYRIVSYLLSFE